MVLTIGDVRPHLSKIKQGCLKKVNEPAYSTLPEIGNLGMMEHWNNG